MSEIQGIRFEVTGADPARLAALWSTGVDDNGDAVVPFVDGDGGWPLRCCLTDSRPGDELAIVAWSPFPWGGPFAERGPIVVHARPCDGPAGAGVPPQFLDRAQVVRPYGADRRITYDHVRLVEAGGGLPGAIAAALADPAVDFVHARNVLAGCWSFTARRSGAAGGW